MLCLGRTTASSLPAFFLDSLFICFAYWCGSCFWRSPILITNSCIIWMSNMVAIKYSMRLIFDWSCVFDVRVILQHPHVELELEPKYFDIWKYLRFSSTCWRCRSIIISSGALMFASLKSWISLLDQKFRTEYPPHMSFDVWTGRRLPTICYLHRNPHVGNCDFKMSLRRFVWSIQCASQIHTPGEKSRVFHIIVFFLTSIGSIGVNVFSKLSGKLSIIPTYILLLIRVPSCCSMTRAPIKIGTRHDVWNNVFNCKELRILNETVLSNFVCHTDLFNDIFEF